MRDQPLHLRGRATACRCEHMRDQARELLDKRKELQARCAGCARVTGMGKCVRASSVEGNVVLSAGVDGCIKTWPIGAKAILSLSSGFIYHI